MNEKAHLCRIYPTDPIMRDGAKPIFPRIAKQIRDTMWCCQQEAPYQPTGERAASLYRWLRGCSRYLSPGLPGPGLLWSNI